LWGLVKVWEDGFLPGGPEGCAAHARVRAGCGGCARDLGFGGWLPVVAEGRVCAASS